MAATILLATVAGAQSAAPVDPGWERFEFQHHVMGVDGRIVVWGQDATAARAAADAGFAEIDRLDAIYSDWRTDSELNRLCARAGDGPVEVSADLFALLSQTQELSQLTGGAFDVTVGPLTRLWRQARAAGVPPRQDDIDAAREQVGWRKLRLAPPRTVELVLPDMQLDLGGIAKGAACRRAINTLSLQGHPRALVELGGDLAVGQPPPGAHRWVVEAGCGDDALSSGRFALRDESLATSGDTWQAFEHDGVRYSHVIDPATGQALTDHRCVVVVGGGGAAVDALASAASLLPPRKLHALASIHGRGRSALKLAGEHDLGADSLGRLQQVGDGAPDMGRVWWPDEGLLGVARGLTAGVSVRSDDTRSLADMPPAGPWIDMLGDGLARWQQVDGDGAPHAPTDYMLEDGVLHIPAAGPGGSLRTKGDFRDLHLRLDFKLAHMANGGLFLRGDRAGGDPAYSGCEIQMLDDHHWEAVTASVLQPWQFTGSVYAAMAPAVADALLPDGKWNTLEVLYQGTRLAVALNGVPLVDVDTADLPATPPFAERAATGFIGLQRYGAPGVTGDTAVWVRHFFLREL